MSKKAENFLFFIIFIAGYISLSVQLLAIRQLGIFVGYTAISTSIIIGIFLIFLTFGYYKGTVLKFNKVLNPRELITRCFYIASIFIVLGNSYFILNIVFSLFYVLNISFYPIQSLLYCLCFFSVPPFLFGYIVSIASRYLDYSNKKYTGRIMAVDTIGSVLGSLLTTLVLMPLIGVNNTLIFLTAIALLSCIFISKKIELAKLIFIFVLVVFFNTTGNLKELFSIVSNNAVSTTMVKDMDDGKSKLLQVNGNLSSKISEDRSFMFRYIKFINENFIETMPADKHFDILALGAGGFTVGIDDKKNSYTFVDVDASLKSVSEKYFLEEPLTPNKKFVVQDAYQFLNTEEKFDLIVLDTYTAKSSIPLQLITQEYFSRVKAVLKPKGVIVMNVIMNPGFKDDYSIVLDNTIRSVFPNISREIFSYHNVWDEYVLDSNVVYVYRHHKDIKDIYTLDKNKSFYDIHKKEE